MNKSLWISTTIVVLMCISIPVLLYMGILTDAKKYSNSFKPTTFTVLNVTQNPYRCCDTRMCLDCSSNAAGLNTCASLNANLTTGNCDNGYYCCHTHCDTCYYTSCSTCTSGSGSNSYTYQCNCILIPYDCNCHCDVSTNDRQCESYCSTCWKPDALVSYVGYQTDVIQQCGIDDKTCLNQFTQSYYVGEVIPGFYQTTNPPNIILRGQPHYNWSGGYIAGMVIFSIVLAAAATVMLRQFWKSYRNGGCTLRRRSRTTNQIEMSTVNPTVNLTVAPSAPPPYTVDNTRY